MEKEEKEEINCSGNHKLGLAMITILFAGFGLLYLYATTLTA